MSQDLIVAAYLLVGVPVAAVLWSSGIKAMPEIDQVGFHWWFTIFTVLLWPVALVIEICQRMMGGNPPR